jgi:hypothetical protein
MNSTRPEIQPLSEAAFDHIQDQMNAGFVFAAAADEYLSSDPARAAMCLGEGEDCLAMAVQSLRRSGLAGNQRQDLESGLRDLAARLDLLRKIGPTSSVAA